MEKRIIELETRLSFQDDTILQLNEVVIELRGEVEKLAGRLKVAEEKLSGLTPEFVVPLEQEDPPPHY
jgi:SlyX protein